jgi:hypothetical protein
MHSNLLQGSYRSPTQNCLLGFIRRAARLDVSTTSRHLQPIKQREMKTTSQLHFCIVRLKSQSLGITICVCACVCVCMCVCVCQYKRRKPIKSIK